MMLKINYNPAIQPMCKTAIESHLKPYLWLVPNWCLVLDVELWDSDPDACGELASVKVNYDYRNICLSFATAWMDRDEDVKRRVVIHELLHGYFSLIADYARDRFDMLCSKDDAPKFNESIQNELRVLHESATQDLAFAIDGFIQK